MRNLIVLAAFTIAAACAPTPAAAPAPADPAPAAPAAEAAPTPEQSPAPAPIADEASCKTAGGDWRRVCRMGKPACVVTYKDAGEACTDGSQCEGGKCVAEITTATPGAAAAGQCVINSDPCGCKTLITDGKAAASLCVD
jgi:hypothetical protein